MAPLRLQGPLASGTLARVAVVVLRPDRTPAERFVVEPRVRARRWRRPACCRCSGTPCAGGKPWCAAQRPHPPAAARPPQVLSGASAGGGTEAALDVAAVEAQLRGVLLKLQYSDAHLARLPPGCTFEVVAYTSVGRGAPGAPPLDAWVEEQPRGGHLELERVRAVRGLGRGLRRVEAVRLRYCLGHQGAPTLSQVRLPDSWPWLLLLAAQAEIVPIKSCTLEGSFQLQLYAES